jgi:outer membrane protein TolC
MILALILISATASGLNAVPESKSLTLKEALELGQKGNSSIEFAELTAQYQQVVWEQNEYQRKDLESSIDKAKRNGSSVPMTADLYLSLNVVPVQNKNNYDLSKLSQASSINSVKYGIEVAYYNTQTAQRSLEIAEASLKRSETQLKNAQEKFSRGTVAKIDVLTAESNNLKAQVSYENSKNSLTSAQMNLAKQLGLDVRTPLVLTSKLDTPKKVEIDIETELAKLKLTDVNYNKAKNNYQISLLMEEYNDRFNLPNTYKHRAQAVDIKSDEVQYKEAQINLEISVREAAASLASSLLNYQSLSKSCDLAQQSYDLSVLRYNSGLDTIYDVQNAEISFKEAEMTRLEALSKYYLGLAKFTYGVF